MAEMDYSKLSPFTEREGKYLTSVLDPTRLEVGESTIDRKDIVSFGGSAFASGALALTFFNPSKTQTMGKLRIGNGSTAAAATPTLCRAGVYKEEIDKSLTLVGSIANDTTLWSAASTIYSRNLTTPFVIEAGARYALGILVVSAFAMPTFKSTSAVASSEALMDPKLCASVTGLSDLPSTIAAGSLLGTSLMLYAVVEP